MKISIVYKFKNGPWGGGNQFLKILKQEFEKNNIYASDIAGADAIIFNSNYELASLIRTRIRYPEKKIIHRLGPVFHLYRGAKWKIIDRLIIQTANLAADLVIFQSEWSYEQAKDLGFDASKKHAFIGNSADNTIFNSVANSGLKGGKVKLVSDSWSDNWKKGFAFYKYLDENLDFKKFEMTFIGNSPIAFKNIRILNPLPSKELASELRKNDIFISAVEDDAYSNSIVEALSCGLPVIGLDSGGNEEIIGAGGELFDSETQMLEKIELLKNNYLSYKNRIKIVSAEEIADRYAVEIENIPKSTVETKKIKLMLIYLDTLITLFLFRIYTGIYEKIFGRA